MGDNIYLTGFMGSGKTTLAKCLAQRLNFEFVDMDEVLEKKFHLPISKIFPLYGEKIFRQEEALLLQEISRKKWQIVATGGGIVESDENIRLMKKTGKIVFLDVPFGVLSQRLSRKDKQRRPLWRGREETKNLFNKRILLYRKTDLRLKVNDEDIDNTLDNLIKQLFLDHTISCYLEDKDCPIYATFQGPEILGRLSQGKKLVILIDQTVSKIHFSRYEHLVPEGLVIKIPPGEGAKNLRQVERIYSLLLRYKIDRGAILVAIGGGVITDLGAYVATTYKRGLDFILVSTSLVGCVDAAIGGKNAVNFVGLKNVIGTFSVPKAVILDLRALSTLKKRQIQEGLIEAYKTGLVAAKELASFIDASLDDILKGNSVLLAKTAMLSSAAKAKIVGQDFRDKGIRRCLNFGHTFGHALETLPSNEMSHGEAVALGMKAALFLSLKKKIISESLSRKITGIIDKIMPSKFDPRNLPKILENLGQDKKNYEGKKTFVLLKNVGHPVFFQKINENEIKRAFLSLKRKQR